MKVQLHHGRDLHCPMIKWSSGQKQKYVVTHILFYARRRYQILQKQIEGGKAQWQTFDCKLLMESYWESIENQVSFEWNIFSRLTSLQILQKIQGDLPERNIEPEKFEDRTIQGVAVNWIFSFRIKFVGLEVILESCRWWMAGAVLDILDGHWEGLRTIRQS